PDAHSIRVDPPPPGEGVRACARIAHDLDTHPSSANPFSIHPRSTLNAAFSVRPRIEIEISGTYMSTVSKLRPARTSRYPRPSVEGILSARNTTMHHECSHIV